MEGEAASDPGLRLGDVLSQFADMYRRSWRDLLLLALAIFAPVGLIESIGPQDGIEVDRLDDLRLIPAALLGIAQVVAPLIGTVFYAGAVSARVVRERGGEHHPLRDVARDLPYGSLIAADLLLVILTGIGLALLIVPGVIVLVRYALIAPVVEVERTGLRASFGRSRELVRGNFWKVCGLVWPATLLSSALEGLSDEVAFDVFRESWLTDWLGSLAGNLLAAPIWALLVIILYLQLRDLEAS